jgi:hypothetical protein
MNTEKIISSSKLSLFHRAFSNCKAFIANKDLYHSPVLNDRIFLFSNKENAMEEANESLACLGLRGEMINEKTISYADLSYKMTFIQLSKIEDASQNANY